MLLMDGLLALVELIVNLVVMTLEAAGALAQFLSRQKEK